MTRQQKRNNLNKALSKVKGIVLQDWLDEAGNICTELKEALSGIYCGRDGKIHEELTGEFTGLFITMGWHTVSDYPKVEFAYVS